MKRLKIFAAAMAAVLALSAVPMVSAKAAGEHKLAAITLTTGLGHTPRNCWTAFGNAGSTPLFL